MSLPKPNKIVAEKYVVGLSRFKDKAARIKLSANFCVAQTTYLELLIYISFSINYKNAAVGTRKLSN